MVERGPGEFSNPETPDEFPVDKIIEKGPKHIDEGNWIRQGIWDMERSADKGLTPEKIARPGLRDLLEKLVARRWLERGSRVSLEDGSLTIFSKAGESDLGTISAIMDDFFSKDIPPDEKPIEESYTV